jgi:hypothetical protein
MPAVAKGRVQELALESSTDRLAGQDNPQQDRAGRAGPDETSRTGQDERERMLSMIGQDEHK